MEGDMLGDMVKLTTNYLDSRKRVVLNDQAGPLLFLTYINALRDGTNQLVKFLQMIPWCVLL